ncbi:GNVR domain-containing protein [Spirosoma soli]|uniref:GNVR domain-containing protein n=1 Tax=Spirosoma soli TaxID=1770529 RepID=A0ABW5MBH7_9BACT
MIAPSTSRTTRTSWLNLSAEGVLRTAWQGRRRLLLFVAVFVGIGIVVALLTPSEFVSEAKIMPEMNNGSGDMVKQLASVAGLAGMNFTDAESIDAVRPDLYPNVLQSTPFILHLLSQSVSTKKGEKLPLSEFLLRADRFALKRVLLTDEGGRSEAKNTSKQAAGPVQLTARQKDLVEDIGQRVSAKLDTRSGIITITAKMPDAHVAATVAQLAMNYLTEYVTSYRTEKARQDLRFYTQRFGEARQRYQTAQFNVFHYNDQHKYFVVQAATMDKQRMEAELTIAQSVYTELSKQYEQAKLNVQERTPVFKVLEPAQVPLKRVSPKRTILILLFALAGFLVGLIYLLIQQADLPTKIVAFLQEHQEPVAV